MILSVSNICKSFGTDVILSNISFHVEAHEKVAIIGINGAGKSTLLKIIAGEMTADSGSISLQKDATVGYLAQQQAISLNGTIYEEVMSVKADILALEENIRRLEVEMKDMQGEELEKSLSRYSRMNADFENANGYSVKSEVTGCLKGLGFTEEDFDKDVSTLSGGQKTRVALAKLLLSKPDIIMLDEPINHLDMDSIRWLEGFLSSYKGAVIIVAHDRYFLDKIVTKVVEIENAKTRIYEGNYTVFSEKKKQEREAMLHAYLNQQREIKHQEEVIAKLKSFNREKSIKRAESREKMLDKIERLDKPQDVDAEMDIRLVPNILSGNDVLSVRHLTKGFDGNTLFENVNFEIKRGDKVAIIGNNGTGKTTLLKILNNLLSADDGSFKLGAKVYTAYYDQEHHVLDPDKSAFQEIQDTYPDMDNTKVRNVLASFLFTGDDVFKLVRDLSGGEKGRLSLAKLMLSDANLLFLDEPTNHLDIISKEILEQAIANYEGTVIYVSHDRYFIKKTATRIFELINKDFVQFTGNYDYYMEKREFLPGIAPAPAAKQSSEAAPANNIKEDWAAQKKIAAERRKLENEFAKTEKRIAELEARNQELEETMQQPDIATQSHKLMELTTEKDSNDTELEKLMTLWEELYEKINEYEQS